MTDEKKLWEISLGVVASEADARSLAEQIERLLCPDPDHTPPCPIPWSISTVAEEHMTADQRTQYEVVMEQHRIESGTD
ncbi:hypothetical protein ACFWBG_02870 [Nocardia salmonicida]|uniref:hypothetical protein n=1 Tax=Nocardia salmonicida TaxID=53431 RepID=UPI0036370CA4